MLMTNLMKRWFRTTVLTVGFLIFLLGGFPCILFALPLEGQITSGDGSFHQPNSNELIIQQNSDRLISQWQQFNIGTNEKVQFLQPNSDAIALNRITGGNPSEILGQLLANGKIFLLNPSGIFFGHSARVDVGGLMASTLSLSDNNFLDGNYSFVQDLNRPLASIINEGIINANGGYVGLLAPSVVNKGTVVANLGSIHMASGEAAVLDFTGDGLINFEITQPVRGDVIDRSGNVTQDRVINSGTLQSDGGHVALSARDAVKVFDNVISHTGSIQARTVEKREGRVFLNGGDHGVTNVTGRIDASGLDGDERGGRVHILGERVGLFDNASVDVSGNNGGGTILIGGDYQGKGEVPNSLVSYVDKGVVLNSRAVNSGDGGKVIVWADDTTRFFGTVDARGGDLSGNGGFVEVSGKNVLSFQGDVDTTAKNGSTGDLLLDPGDITIADGAGTDSLSSGALTVASGTSTIFEQNLESVAATTNITLEAGASITVADLSDDLLDLQQTSGNSVTFTTTDEAGTISFADVFDEIRTQGGSITMNSSGGTVSVGKLTSNGGAITLNGADGVTVNGDIRTGGGNYTVDADSDNGSVGVYTQGVNKTVRTGGGAVNIIASDVDLLNGSANISGSTTNFKSIITGSGFTDGGSVTFNQSFSGKTIGIGESAASDFNIDQNELASIRTPTLNIGSNGISADVTIGTSDFGLKATTITSGSSITLSGSKVIYRKDLALTAKDNVTISNGSSVEAHISGKNASFSATADSDQLNGGGFSLDGTSSITTQGGNVTLIGNTVTNSGTITTNGGTLTTTERSTGDGSSSSTSSPSSVNETSSSVSGVSSSSSSSSNLPIPLTPEEIRAIDERNNVQFVSRFFKKLGDNPGGC